MVAVLRVAIVQSPGPATRRVETARRVNGGDAPAVGLR